ncbi:uncharacterized protein [Halyomorpha halys]
MTSFLLKQSPMLSKLSLYSHDDKDIEHLEDIKYINTPCKVSFTNREEHMCRAIKTADIIIIADDNPREMNQEATFQSRAQSFSNYVQQIAEHNSDAIIVVATNPVNMTVPLAAEVLRNCGKLDERKLLGMTNVENMRARSILAHDLQTTPGTIEFPVIGGLTSETCVPLLSNMNPHFVMSKAKLQRITCAVKTSRTKQHNAEESQESLSRAYATAELIKSIVTGLNGHPTVETVLSIQKIIKNTDFFSLPVLLGENGIVNHLELPNISQREHYLLAYAVKCMAADSTKAKHLYDKLTNNFVKPSTPQNKLDILQTSTIQKKQPQAQYVSIHNRTDNISHTRLNKTSPQDIKLKPTVDHTASTICSCNENMKKKSYYNKLKCPNDKKILTKANGQVEKANDTALLLGSFKDFNQTQDQSEYRNNIVYSDTGKENFDEMNNLNQEKLRYNKNKTLTSQSEIGIGEASDAFKFKTQDSTTANNVNREEKIIPTGSLVNYLSTKLKTKSVSSQLDNEAKKFISEKNKLSFKYNITRKQKATSENISEEKKSLPSEKLENIFTSNVVKMVNEIQRRKQRLTAISDAFLNQPKNIFEKKTEAIDFVSKCNTQNGKYFDLFKTSSKHKGDTNFTINKIDGPSISYRNLFVSNDSKTSGEKYSLQTNQPNRILQSMLFKTDKRPILSRYASSESHDINTIDVEPEMEMRPSASFPHSQRNIKNIKESLWSQFTSSQSQDQEMKYINSTSEYFKNKVISLPKSQTEIEKPREAFLSQSTSSESVCEDVENKKSVDFNSKNNIKQATSLSNFQTNTHKSHEFLYPQDTSSESKDDRTKNNGLNTLNFKEKGKAVNSFGKPTTYIDRADEPRTESDSLPPSSRLGSDKQYYFKRTFYPKFKETSDISLFENLLQKQKDSISSGHKIASFRTERSDISLFARQRKATHFETIDKAVRHRNNGNDLQKLHLLSINPKECFTKDKVLENVMKSSLGKDSLWKNNYFEKNNESSMTNISKKGITETTITNMANAQQESTKGENKNNSIPKEGILDDISTKTINSDTVGTSNNQLMTTASKSIEKDEIQDHTEQNSERMVDNEKLKSEENSIKQGELSSKQTEYDTDRP